MKPYSPSCKLAVRDSLDDEYSDDVEDDVFIRDGRSGKLSEENGQKRPLMAPRRKKQQRTHQMASLMKKRARLWRCCEPFCYGFVALVVLIGIIVGASMLLTIFPEPMHKIQKWMNQTPSAAAGRTGASDETIGAVDRGIFFGEEVPCTQISVKTVWSRAFARLNSESPVRKVDVNGDHIDDIIVGYGLDDSFQYDDVNVPKCDAAVGGFCEGGLLALDGRTGDVLWQSWTAFNVFSVFCTHDLNADGQVDCVAAGRGGLVVAIDGKSGTVIWRLVDADPNSFDGPVIIDLYTVNSVRDVDADQVPDIVAVHVEEREVSRAGHIKLISGKTGKVIRTIATPYNEEVFVPVQIVTLAEGTEYLLITTGGQSTPGGLYMLKLGSIMQYTKESDLITVYRSSSSGFMVPPVLVDINNDGFKDIVAAAFNSTVFAFDGQTRTILWSHSFAASETVSSIVPGHFNSDNVTDFMVKYNSGPGFPIYYYSQTTVLNGINGSSLLDRMILDAGGPYSLLGGMSVSQTLGGDFFLHWQSQCKGRTQPGEAYQFIPDSDIVQQSRADTCKLRYNTSTILQLSAISRHIEPPGAVLFTTDDMMLQLNQSETRATNAQIPIKHPKLTRKLMTIDQTLHKDPPNDLPPIADAGPPQSAPPLVPFVDPNPPDNHVLDQILQQQQLQLQQQQLQKQQQEQPPQRRTNSRLMTVDSYPDVPYQYPSQDRRRLVKIYDVPDSADDYESYLNLDAQNKDPMVLRSRYSINRDVRSESGEIVDVEDVTSNETASETGDNPRASVVPKRAAHKETLWDLELDKELSESEAGRSGPDFDFSSKTRRDIPDSVQAFLPAIASSGVLTASIENTTSSIDFTFVMNVRESETFPPLLTPVDVACVDEKMEKFRNFKPANPQALEQKFLKDCLRQRLASEPPARSVRFESQIVVTRISISCSCAGATLKDGEVCSRLNDIDRQRWTGFMGDDRDGVYT